jgi:hypothetical protein
VAKKPKFDPTSFNFGANRKPRKPKAGKKPSGGGGKKGGRFGS